MFNIITLTGPSGCGKSEILKLINKIDDSYSILPKYTTREKRKDDDNSIINVEKLPENCDYKYVLYGKKYGFSSNLIYDYYVQGKKPVIIVNDEVTLKKLHNRFGESVKSYFVHRGKPSLNKLIAICNSRGVIEPDIINSRYEVANSIYKMYTNNIRLFDSIILNVGNLEETHQILKQVIDDVNGESTRHAIEKGNKLFIVSGNAGSGKDFIVKTAGQIGCTTVPKHTSRPRNPNDGSEMVCPGDNNFDLNGCDLKYENCGTVYGIKKDEILRNLIFGNRNQVLCCSNIGAIKELKNTFGRAVVPLYVHSDITPEEYMISESEEGSNINYIKNRIDGFKNAHIDYTNNIKLFDRCLIYADDERELLRQFAGVLGVNINAKMSQKSKEKGEI